jgi:lectin-like protein
VDPPERDASPIDARPCTGGDAHMSSPTGACFFLFTAPATYANAQAGCAAAGGHLAILRNAQDDAIAQQLAGTRDAFFGLSDQVTEGAFLWTDGAALIYADWYPGEPNDGGGAYPEDCGVINGARGGAWDDRPCEPIPNVGGGLYAYLCES